MKNAKVIIVDDEPIVRSGLENWLSRDYKVISFDSADSFLSALNQLELDEGLPTCILLDFQMPGMNGVELQESLKLMNAKFPIVFMSGNAQQADIINAWRGGAIDFVLKPFTPTQVTDALERLFSQLNNPPIESSNPNSDAHTDIPITKREAEVLLLLGKGHLQNEVSQLLGISIRTVKMYRSFLKDKLGLNTLAELGQFYNKIKRSIEKLIAKN